MCFVDRHPLNVRNNKNGGGGTHQVTENTYGCDKDDKKIEPCLASSLQPAGIASPTPGKFWENPKVLTLCMNMKISNRKRIAVIPASESLEDTPNQAGANEAEPSLQSLGGKLKTSLCLLVVFLQGLCLLDLCCGVEVELALFVRLIKTTNATSNNVVLKAQREDEDGRHEPKHAEC